MSYKAIGFDYGGVIGGAGTSNVSDAERICKLLGISRDVYRENYFAINHLMMLGDLESWEDFWRIFLDKVGQPEKLTNLIEMDAEYTRNLQVVDERQIELIDGLRTQGYRLGLLSNTTLAGAQNMRELGIDKHFDVFFASAERKMMKPSPKAFLAFAGELGVEPNEMIFIDDAEKSLSTADECGFTPILFKNYDQLVAELRQLKVL